MYRRAEDMRIRKVEKPFGGEGTVTFTDWLLPEEAPGHGRVFSKVTIPPGGVLGYHEHEGEFEAYYILSGTATVDDNGTEVVLHAGDMQMCPNGQGHCTRNRESEDLVLMALIMNDLSEKE